MPVDNLQTLFELPIPAPQSAPKAIAQPQEYGTTQTPNTEHPVPLRECGEPLVPVPETSFLRCVPEYHRRGVANALAVCYVREGVATRLEQVARRLGEWQLTLTVWDAWRSVAVQQAIFDEYQADLRGRHPHLSPEELETRTREFVALPSTDPMRVSPHLTGGAIDVTLADGAGNLLPMGTDYDDFSPRAATRFFEPFPDAPVAQNALSPDEQMGRNHRRLLYHVMTEAGFTNYESEWWHFDYGNRLWARQTGLAPIYGATQPFLP